MKKSAQTISWNVLIVVVALLDSNLGWAQTTVQPRDRLCEEITESSMVTLSGNVHPALARAVSQSSVDASFPMEHMILLLQPEPSQQAELDQLVAEQHDPQSPQYHQFLTTEQYAARFGVSQNDIAHITSWLSQYGFVVEEVTANRLSIVFSGDAFAVQSAFKTEIKRFTVNGEVHYANSTDPQIPSALAGVVKGVVKLHDFHARSFSHGLWVIGDPIQSYLSGSPNTHYLTPADFATIYHLWPLYNENLNGAGQNIAVVGRSNVKMSDIQSFRSQFGLPFSNPTVIVAQGTDPGFTNDGDAIEATLDVEWAGAIAPKAHVNFVISGDTSTSDGVDLAALYAVNHNVAPILSVSFGSCEAEMSSNTSANGGGTALAFYNSLWQQAASQGISVFVAAGDSGAAGCDSGAAISGSMRAINGICSSPYATCVGGTEFKEGSNTGLYWLPGTNALQGTAQSYIPEVVWNESGSNGGAGLTAGGGGASVQWTKPSWQSGPGVPSDGYRDVPDMALSASVHDGYLIVYNGNVLVAAGTSVPAPSLAGLFAIVNEKYNNRQGNINPVLYPLAAKQAQGGAAVFHDITSGNNTVPGVSGYAAGVGYDLASGLGSIDAFQLVSHFQDVSLNGTFALAIAPATVSLQPGQTATLSTVVTGSNGFNGQVSLGVSGVPTGITATFSQAALPGPGTSSLQLAANNTVVPGSYTLTIGAKGGGITQTALVNLSVSVIAPKCSLTAIPAILSLNLGQTSSVQLTCDAPQGNLPTALALSVSGQPSGVSTAFSPATLVPGTGVGSLTITVAAKAPTGTYALLVAVTGDAFRQTINLPLTVITPTFTVTLASNSVSVVQGTSAPVLVTVLNIGSFNEPVNLVVTGLPNSMTGVFAPANFPPPGFGQSALTLVTIISPSAVISKERSGCSAQKVATSSSVGVGRERGG